MNDGVCAHGESLDEICHECNHIAEQIGAEDYVTKLTGEALLRRMTRKAIKVHKESQQALRDLNYWNDVVRPEKWPDAEPIEDPGFEESLQSAHALLVALRGLEHLPGDVRKAIESHFAG